MFVLKGDVASKEVMSNFVEHGSLGLEVHSGYLDHNKD